MIQHLTGILMHPSRQWLLIAPRADRGSNLVYVMALAVLPAVAWYFGTTRVGWTVGAGEVIGLTRGSAVRLIVLFYLAMVVSVCVIGWFIHWMAAEYGAQSTPMRGVSIAGFTATPLLLAGVIGFYPMLWVALLVAIGAVSWSLYLLYT
jgi:hypothetical protein